MCCEEMPTNEAVDLIGRARTEKVAPLGVVIMNQLQAQLFDETGPDALKSPAETSAALETALRPARPRQDKEADERLQVARLREGVGALDVVEVPKLKRRPLGLAAVRAVAEHLGVGGSR